MSLFNEIVEVFGSISHNFCINDILSCHNARVQFINIYIANMKKHMDNIHCRPSYQGCDFGNKQTTFGADMKDHNENMHIPGTYQHCVFCSKPYLSSANMMTHIEFIHSQGTYYHCDCCSKLNPYSADVTYHNENKHKQNYLPTYFFCQATYRK